VGEPLPILEAPQAYGVRRQIMLADAPIQAILVAADIERAKKFYVEKLGLQPVDAPLPEDGAAFESGKGTWLYMYEREGGSRADHTVAGWMVDDVETAVAELRKRGVVFEQYDVPGLKTDERGIAVSGPAKSAWFKDSEGNILAVTEM
jgi:catechol 2,3-dioxygenase-like lactoylglutathione lyase family enzyme